MIKRVAILVFMQIFVLNAKCESLEKASFLGLNPSVTVEPYYNKGEFDINVFPVVYQRTISERIDFRASVTLNYGVREISKSISHFGGQLALPIFYKKKENLMNPSSGLFIAPGLGFTRNNLEKHTNIGFWLEPGYNLQISDKWSISFGVQLGATNFNYDDGTGKWGEHFGMKIIIGRWF